MRGYLYLTVSLCLVSVSNVSASSPLAGEEDGPGGNPPAHLVSPGNLAKIEESIRARIMQDKLKQDKEEKEEKASMEREIQRLAMDNADLNRRLAEQERTMQEDVALESDPYQKIVNIEAQIHEIKQDVQSLLEESAELNEKVSLAKNQSEKNRFLDRKRENESLMEERRNELQKLTEELNREQFAFNPSYSPSYAH